MRKMLLVNLKVDIPKCLNSPDCSSSSIVFCVSKHIYIVLLLDVTKELKLISLQGNLFLNIKYLFGVFIFLFHHLALDVGLFEPNLSNFVFFNLKS